MFLSLVILERENETAVIKIKVTTSFAVLNIHEYPFLLIRSHNLVFKYTYHNMELFALSTNLDIIEHVNYRGHSSQDTLLNHNMADIFQETYFRNRMSIFYIYEIKFTIK